jgi:hypothetical protein
MEFGCDMRGIARYGVISGYLKLLPFILVGLMAVWIIIIPGVASLCVRGEAGVTADGRRMEISHVEAWPSWPGFIYVGTVTHTDPGKPELGIPERAMRMHARLFVDVVTLE